MARTLPWIATSDFTGAEIGRFRTKAEAQMASDADNAAHARLEQLLAKRRTAKNKAKSVGAAATPKQFDHVGQIRKLEALANHPNTPQHEAANARKKADELRAKYHVTRTAAEQEAMIRQAAEQARSTAKAERATAKAEPKAKRAERAAEPKQGRAKRTEPGEMGAKIIEACLRPEGATPAYLNKLTNWHGAPWKWYLSNRKGTGVADKYGYVLNVIPTDEGGVSYHLSRKRNGNHHGK